MSSFHVDDAKYTVKLKTLLEDENIRPLIEKAMSTYPMYEKKSKEEFIPSYIPTREELNQKILNYYKYREIGFETVGRFLDELEIALIEIMPYYCQLFFSADMDYNVIHNVDYVKEIKIARDGKNTNTTAGNDKTTSEVIGSSSSETKASDTNTTNASVENYNKGVKSDTPQGQLGITNKNIDTVDYASELSFSHDSNSDTGSSSGSSESNSKASSNSNTTNETTSNVNSNGTNEENEASTEITKGNYGQVSYQSLLDKYRDLIVNIEQRIINDPRIAELFMQVY